MPSSKANDRQTCSPPRSAGRAIDAIHGGCARELDRAQRRQPFYLGLRAQPVAHAMLAESVVALAPATPTTTS